MGNTNRSLLIAASLRPGRNRDGYALLLTVMILAAMLVIGLTITSIVIVQTRLSTRIFNAMRALAAADSGIERGLYEDFIVGGWDSPYTPYSANIGNGSYTVTKCPADVPVCGPPNATVLRSVGTYGGAQRSVEVSY